MKTTLPRHGERACYQRGCRLPECRLANYRYSKKLGADHARGEYREHDTTQARAHMERLFAHQWRQADIARATGISRSLISLIAQGQRTTSRRNVLAILSIPVSPLVRTGPQARVSAVGSQRRLRALATIGHSWPAISSRTGITHDRLGDIARGLATEVRPDEAQAITRVYRTLCATRGRCEQVASSALKKGWHGPLAWDAIDDPAAEPETAEPYKPIAKGGRDNLRRQEIKHLLDCGESVASIAKQMSANQKYISDLISQGLGDSDHYEEAA